MATTQAGDSEKVFVYLSFLPFFLRFCLFHFSVAQSLHNNRSKYPLYFQPFFTLLLIFSLFCESFGLSLCLQFLSVCLFVFCLNRHTLVATDSGKSADSKYMHSVTRRSVPLKKANSHWEMNRERESERVRESERGERVREERERNEVTARVSNDTGNHTSTPCFNCLYTNSDQRDPLYIFPLLVF